MPSVSPLCLKVDQKSSKSANDFAKQKADQIIAALASMGEIDTFTACDITYLQGYVAAHGQFQRILDGGGFTRWFFASKTQAKLTAAFDALRAKFEKAATKYVLQVVEKTPLHKCPYYIAPLIDIFNVPIIPLLQLSVSPDSESSSPIDSRIRPVPRTPREQLPPPTKDESRESALKRFLERTCDEQGQPIAVREERAFKIEGTKGRNGALSILVFQKPGEPPVGYILYDRRKAQGHAKVDDGGFMRIYYAEKIHFVKDPSSEGYRGVEISPEELIVRKCSYEKADKGREGRREREMVMTRELAGLPCVASVRHQYHSRDERGDLNHCYYIMDYYNRGSCENTTYRLEGTVDIGRQVSEGLSHIHAKGCLHNDFSPPNILRRSREGGGIESHVSDFGGAARVGSIDSETQFGRYQYRAPEVYLDPGSVTAKADSWSLGVALFRMCYGKLPAGLQHQSHEQDGDGQLNGWYISRVRAIFRAPEYWAVHFPTVSDVSQMREVYELRFQDLIRRLLTIDPEKRPTCLEAHRELAQIHEGLQKLKASRKG